MGSKKEAEKQRRLEAERARLMQMSEKELLVEILLSLRGIKETDDEIAFFSAFDAFRK